MKKRDTVRTTIRLSNELMNLIYKYKLPHWSINDFICQSVQTYLEQKERQQIDKAFEGDCTTSAKEVTK